MPPKNAADYNLPAEQYGASPPAPRAAADYALPADRYGAEPAAPRPAAEYALPADRYGASPAPPRPAAEYDLPAERSTQAPNPLQESSDPWTGFFQRVKQKPSDFYQKCRELLDAQDIYDPGDLADTDFDMFKAQLEKSNATAGLRTFLELAVDLAKAEKLRLETEELQRKKLGDQTHSSAAASQPTCVSMPAPPPAVSGPTPALRPTSSAPVDDQDDSIEPGFPVARLMIPGTEDAAAVVRRGGMQMKWTSRDGTERTITKFRETPMRRIVDKDLALPTLYLHFLDQGFFVKEGEYNLALRAGNDNSELQTVLPEDLVPQRNSIPEEWRPSFDTVMRFLRSQCEVMAASVEEKPGGFSPKKSYKTTIHTKRLYFSLRTARPKAPINLDKTAFGIPDEAELYLFAENHTSVAFMSQRDTDAFNKCIEETLQLGGDIAKFGVFLKVFYEGAFAYNQKIPMGKGFLPKNIGIACMGVTQAFDGQSGIATGYPYLLESRFLPFIDTVPVTIRAIADMSPRHSRYGLCFTNNVFVWETEALAREGVLNFCSLSPHGGFYYCPETLRKHWKLGGLIYAFGEARDELEQGVSIDSASGAASPGAQAGGGQAGAASPALADHRACVICLSEEAVFATVPCGHRAFCEGCSATAKRRNCPVCRTLVQDVMRIFG